MINSKKTLHTYIKEDGLNYPLRNSGWLRRIRNNIGVTPISDQRYIWLYIKTMRYLEYYMNKKQKCWDVLFRLYYNHKLRKYAYKTGFQIPPNTIGKGLTIWHWGPIIINENARIGDNATIQTGVIVGHKKAGEGCPIIGDNVVLGSGCKVFGNICIGDNVEIAPNACVVKDCNSNAIYGGVPAKVLRVKHEGFTD